MSMPISLGVLFPFLGHLSDLEPNEGSKIVKQNPTVDDVASLSELVDAFWWCLYGYVFTTKNDGYINDKQFLWNDLRCLVKCERLRMLNKKHRYPTTHPKRRGRKANEKQENRLKMYENLVEQASQILDTESQDEVRQLRALELLTDLRNKQECILGYDWKNVSCVRQTQYSNISELLDCIFIHRKYVSRNQEEGGELLTPEEANEWDDAQKSMKVICREDSTPHFIRNLVKMQSVMIEV